DGDAQVRRVRGDARELRRGAFSAGRAAEEDHAGKSDRDVEEIAEAGEPCAGRSRHLGRNPLISSQKLKVISKSPSGLSNHQRFTASEKSGETMKARVHATAQTDETTPNTAKPRGR